VRGKIAPLHETLVDFVPQNVFGRVSTNSSPTELRVQAILRIVRREQRVRDVRINANESATGAFQKSAIKTEYRSVKIGKWIG
jgi:hypothetical protein